MKFLYFFTLFVHLGFAAILYGGSCLAVFFDLISGREQESLHRKLSADLLARVILTPGSSLLFVFTLALVFFSLEKSYASVRLPAFFAGGVLLLLALALLLLHLYRGLREKGSGRGVALVVGLAALSLLSGVYFILACGSTFFLMPERWPVLAATPTLVLSWSGVARFLQFVSLAFILTGGGMVLFSGRDGEDKRLAGRIGAAVALAFLLALPLCLLLELVNLPLLAHSAPLFGVAAMTVITAATTALLLLPFCFEPVRRNVKPPFVLALGLLFLFVLGDHLGRESALTPLVIQALAAENRDSPLPRAESIPAAPPSSQEAIAGRGEEIFNRVCSGCHAFEGRRVGPPLSEVIPGYRGRRGALANFIANPVKMNPDYPAMPDPGLSEAEISAVVDFLLGNDTP
ncbi:cytochrome c551/c552 [Desulfuromonas soudanensis]|uniref:Cytochrome c551/c552 n=1 Tax=Desulfuromonas soudanensis TaxID=1603606 RepID=A0A0M4DAK3_9BACT|nr:cytochrome c [Desulfuromonas soudanensis]ALC17192.1 cytochrome c551/c552 [Desulfuromonas soudanensis]